MPRLVRASLSFGLGLLSGCALRGDVRKVELQAEALRQDLARSDSARQADRDSILKLVAAVQGTITAQQATLAQMRGDLKTDLQTIQQQLASVQELTGQSQQRLSELRSRIGGAVAQSFAVPDSARRAGLPAVPAGLGPDQMYELSLQQYRRGSFTTAREAFREFLRAYPDDERAPDALFYVGETLAAQSPDSATAVYQTVVKTYPNSPRAPSALYKLGLLAEQRGDKASARTYYARVVAGYPRSDEANLARDKLQSLGR